MSYDDYLRREAIKSRINDGWSRKAVAKDFGISKQRVSQIVGGRRKPDIVWDEESINFALVLWNTGISVSEIGRAMGVTKNCISGIAFRNNFPPRQSPILRRRAA